MYKVNIAKANQLKTDICEIKYSRKSVGLQYKNLHFTKVISKIHTVMSLKFRLQTEK